MKEELSNLLLPKSLVFLFGIALGCILIWVVMLYGEHFQEQAIALNNTQNEIYRNGTLAGAYSMASYQTQNEVVFWVNQTGDINQMTFSKLCGVKE
mgnify:CR=1 FL=1